MKNRDFKIHNIAAKYILGENIDISIKGNKEQLICLQELLETSRKLYLKLEEKNVSLDEILEINEKKKLISERFFNLTEIKWKL